MDKERRVDFVVRNEILKLLSEAELAKVTNAETVALSVGDEYIDLERLAQGVRRARAETPSAHVLSRKALPDMTWTKILGLLPAEAAQAVQSAHP